jgi:hypothetical protein
MEICDIITAFSFMPAIAVCIAADNIRRAIAGDERPGRAPQRSGAARLLAVQILGVSAVMSISTLAEEGREAVCVDWVVRRMRLALRPDRNKSQDGDEMCRRLSPPGVILSLGNH